ncbi:hypothetical protein [Kutzneria buriramensis]|uniref:LppP/LprE lipoprotein n=1 Tax=Kutzneria buriramensis TaxID=1045776 RepID=A0A3E0HIS7_9PSEU|nr:hypothetical protein [Kutzneria buriramensis]REH45965.1 hypothetical protein BCF44_10797 [Kutzneria buriramensis]
MRTLRLTVALGLLVTATACGTAANGNVSDPGPAMSTSSPPTGGPATSTGVSGPVGQPNVARPDARVIDQRPLRWSRAEAGDGPQLVIHYTTAGLARCSTLGRVDVAETTSTVTVTVLVGQLPGANCAGDQPQLAAQFVTTVTLQRPLGARTVVDGAR